MKAFIFAMFLVLSLSLMACSGNCGNKTAEGSTSDSTSVVVDSTATPAVEVSTPDSTQ